jgi:DNA-binding HxlR family transcriptional regulator
MTRPVPQPGRPVRGSQTGRPLMAALDLLGRRWALRLLWELRGGPLGARALRERCDAMSSSVLYERLSELNAAGLIAKDDNGDYALTALGTDLGSALDPLDQWSRRWAEQRTAR